MVHVYANYVSDGESVALYPTSTDVDNPNFTTDESSELIMFYNEASPFREKYKKGKLFIYNGRFLKSRRAYVLSKEMDGVTKEYIARKADLENPPK